MREYKNEISLSKNKRGIYSIDPSIGCYSGTKENKKGCYNDCYAARNARIYGYDFNKTVLRSFKSNKHLNTIKLQIRKIKQPFVRMGTMGDPSENWGHTINICELLQNDNQLSLFEEIKKEIVIITKHWNNLTNIELKKLKKLKICINTSISAMDKPFIFNNSLNQFEILKPFCRSVLRIVSCDFNINNDTGKKLNAIQNNLFKKYNVLDTIFRVSKNNKLVERGVINIKESKFMGKKCYISRYNKKTYFGKCDKCSEMCGLKLF